MASYYSLLKCNIICFLCGSKNNIDYRRANKIEYLKDSTKQFAIDLCEEVIDVLIRMLIINGSPFILNGLLQEGLS